MYKSFLKLYSSNILCTILLCTFVFPGSAFAVTMDDAKSAVRTRNYEKAFDIYKRFAQKNNKEAQYQLGAMYKSGRGINKNEKSAVHWFKKSAAQGYAKAQ